MRSLVQMSPVPFNCPCTRDCPDRKSGCHSVCEKYINAKAEYEQAKEKYRQKRSADVYISDMIRRSMDNRAKAKKKSYKRYCNKMK